MRVVLVVIKVNNLADDEMEDLAELVDTYHQASYRVLMTSARTGAGVDDVRELLAGRVTLVAGHSGVGKSTLINSIDPALDLHTAVISEASEKGQHTTTYAEMFELGVASDELRVASDQPADTRRSSLATQAVIPPTFIIDTPGIKGFGLVDLEAEDIGDQFPEIFRLKGGCRFNNCLHKDEPGCAVRAAVEAGELAGSRYSSYRDMLEGIDEESPYRLD